MVRIKIHRGTDRIGGTITEIYTENTHIFIDFGSELSVTQEDSTDDKMIAMINNTVCDAVLFSHYHGDHVGLLEHIPNKDIRGKEIRLGIGEVARKVLINIRETLANSDFKKEEKIVHKKTLDLLKDDRKWILFRDALSFTIGDFRVTTIRVDHSAYDSYLFVIEAEGRCIVHTGDFRLHGRLGDGFFEKLKHFMKGKKVDVLLMEGTMLGRGGERVLSEKELQEEAKKILMKPENKYAYLICSSTNMENLASFHNAVLFSNQERKKLGDRACNRAMYVNFYVKKQLDLFAGEEPDATLAFCKAYPFEPLEKYNERLKMSQMEYMEENGFLILLGKSKAYEKYIKPFQDKNPLLIYSMWDGYVGDESSLAYDKEWGNLYYSFKRKVRLHTAGHARKEDLEEMIAVINPRDAILPMHTEFKEKYESLKGAKNRVRCLTDGETYTVGEFSRK